MAFSIENSECFSDLFFDISVFVHVFGHEIHELVEADAAVAVLVDLVDHLLRENVVGIGQLDFGIDNQSFYGTETSPY